LKRRRFIQAATVSVLLPATVESRCLHAFAVLSPNDDYAFFDERFEKARRLAASWSGSNEAIAVHGDITPLWNNGLDSATRKRTLRLRGVTAESFRFCLGILVSEHADLHLHASRLDRDLFLWTMHTTPRLRVERRNG
jgi:hypothetical protein